MNSGTECPVSYVPYKEVGSRPNTIVDGPPLASTVLTLSHWPNNQTPDSLQRDTSTATVFAYLDAQKIDHQIEIVSNNHFDEDGLFSMFTFCNPDLASKHRALLESGGLAGDFGIVNNPDAARLCFIIEAFTDPAVSPLDKEIFRSCEERRVASFYRALLPLVADFLQDPGSYKKYWQDQYEHLELSQSLVKSGKVAIEERPEHDLAIIRIPADLPQRTVRRYLNEEQAAIHPFAINSATRCNRILQIYRGGIDLHYRYESWLRFTSWRPQLRVSLEGIADQLNALEKSPGIWRGEDVNDVIPRLYLDGCQRTSLAEDQFVTMLEEYLANEPVAWDPYDWQDTT
ncbi:MAG: hypothetical protein QGH93_01900 [Gammaproteobacteria bacterium]|jgi:hypothetical protein|nr:hypothetical protein [Chromatiales bacterium]MDP6673591.1 hypothetical protein [Gammaproteobacteria bacterium]